ncbi:hypothetical protein [Suttonella ornithocola]|uniref:hypothetical protein n=1 Tax=Suttonella ornithocola TaxID=279832 RepID=UPI0009355D60|nr:hypothetical protein [Suttonella ornithocola]
MASGERLNFTQDYFDFLCLDLSQYPISRAVAASSAVPGIFTPLTLNNHSGYCNYQQTQLTKKADIAKKQGIISDWQRWVVEHKNATKKPYLHLIDGGLSDNLGLRSLLDLRRITSAQDTAAHNSHIKPKRVFISVNAALGYDNSIDESANIPPLKRVISGSIDIAIDRFSEETAKQFSEALKNKQENVENYFIRLNLYDLSDSELADRVNNIKTSFKISSQDIEDLLQAAEILLDKNEEFIRLKNDLNNGN